MINPDIVFCCGKVIFDLYIQQFNVYPIDNFIKPGESSPFLHFNQNWNLKSATKIPDEMRQQFSVVLFFRDEQPHGAVVLAAFTGFPADEAQQATASATFAKLEGRQRADQ